MSISQLKLELHYIFKKDEGTTTNFQPTNDGDVINKAYSDERLLKINGRLSILET